MEFIFLGTGAGVPAKLRNVSAMALQLLEKRRSIWLFDCGEGTQQQILKTKIKPGKIEKIFITHLHGDHIFGLPGLLGSRSFQGGTDRLTVYGPQGIRAFIDVALDTSKTHLKYPLEIVEISEGLIFEDEQFTVEVFRLDHAIESYGYRIVEKDMPGSLEVDKLKALGIMPGPLYKRIKNGEVIELEDGRIIHGADYTTAPQKGIVIAVSGDTRRCENSMVLALDADWLVHEATFKTGQEEMAATFYHSTNVDAAELAKQAQVKNLLLTHISSRFMEEDMAEFLDEAKAVFPNVRVVKDFEIVKIK